MRVCIRKSDDRIIEAQGNDAAPMDALRNNAKSAGYNLKDLTFTVLPDQEVSRRIAQQDAPPLSAAHVKAEAARRITALFPDWKQRNMVARGLELLNARMSDKGWTAAEATEAAEMQAAWDWIKSVRAASEAIERLATVPVDYAEDQRWPDASARGQGHRRARAGAQ